MRVPVFPVVLALLLGIALTGIAQADPPMPEPAPEPTSNSTNPAPASGINLVFNWDFGVIATAVKRALQEHFGGIVDGVQRSIFDPISQSSLNFLTQTPPAATYGNGTVVTLWEYSRGVASAAFALILIVSGYAIMSSQANGTPFADAILALRGALFGLLLANTSLWWIGLAVDLGNALTSGVGGVSLPSASQRPYTTLPPEQILLALIYIVMGLLLLLQMLMRLALLDVLIVVAPIAVLVRALPEAQQWARLWRDLFVATLFSQFVQILALRLGTALMTQLVPNFADSVVGILAGIAVLVITLKIPGLLSVGVHRAGGSASVLGTLLAFRGAQRLFASSAAAGRTAGGAAAGGRASAGAGASGAGAPGAA